MQKEFNSNPVDIIAGVAPSIGRCCYEVDWGVAQYFQEYNNAFDKIGDKYMLDLPYINKSQLLKAGLQEKNIELSNICTACEVDRYFSYRKENGCSGRFMSMIGMPL
jgi:copper oxidase (laccase) domain-containing protein